MASNTQLTDSVGRRRSRRRGHVEKRRTLVTLATYNEMANLPQLVDEIFRCVSDVDILVIDDNSPDATGVWCDQKAAEERRFHCRHRSSKLGLGSAIIAGMQYAIEHNYDYVLNMDADFSHHPRYLPTLLSKMDDSTIDVVIGSRYVVGGQVQGWPLLRRIMSRCVNWYARLLLRLKVKDCSGAFRCYRTDRLKGLGLENVRSRGFSFQEEILWRLKESGAKMIEIPIVFQDRQRGRSKINLREAFSAMWVILALRCGRFPRRRA